MTEHALSNVVVVDLTTDFGYAAKLFAELGATVVLVEPPEGSRARARPPLAGDESLWFAYRNCGKESIGLDVERTEDRDELRQLLARADIVFDDHAQAYWIAYGLGYDALKAANPELVFCAITPYGQSGPAASAKGCDLTAMASGGMAWLTGYEDVGPIVGDCSLATTSAAQYAAVIALIAMLGRRNVGGGQFVDVSMQEVVALGTETAPQFFAMKNLMRRRLGASARQAGIGVYPCADGHVFLYAAESGVGRGWNLLAQWLCDEGVPGAAVLCDERWRDNGFKAQPAQRATFAALWETFAKVRSRQWLFREGQRRRIAISPLNYAADVVADEHLKARGFFDERGWPGAPYRLSATPWQSQPSIHAAGTDADAVHEIVSAPRTPAPALPASGTSKLPLAGLRVVDFTWVGAGPLTTKLLADFGAEVWKIESTSRPDQLRRAEPLASAGGLDASGYFANRNTNKKSVTLDLKNPDDLAQVKVLVDGADIVANSFSPGVMERLGLPWEEVARINPRVIYLSMPFAGDDGPYRDYLGYGINIATLVGTFGRHCIAGRIPVGTGTNFPDHLPNPLHACFAVLAALAWREQSGKGQRIAVAQLESTLAACPDAVLDFVANGNEAPLSAYVEPWRSPHGIFRTLGNDRWCALSVDDDATFLGLCALLGRADIEASARYSERDAIAARVAEWMMRHTAEDAVILLRKAGAAAAVVATPEDLLARDEHLTTRGFWQYLEHPVMGRGVYHGIAAVLSVTPTRYRTGAPLLGQHNDELAALTDRAVALPH